MAKKRRGRSGDIEFILAIIIAILLILTLVFQQSLQIPFVVVTTLVGAFILIKIFHIARKGGTVFEDYISLIIIGVFFIIQFAIEDALNNVILVVVILTILYSVGIIPSFRHMARSKSITTFIISYFIFILAIISLFAGAFMVNDNQFSLEGEQIQIDFADSLYFSIISFTTVGYGDIAPLGMNKFLASLESLFAIVLNIAFVGYILASRRFIPEKRESK